MPSPQPMTVDVRDTLRAGGEPFGEIMRAVGTLAPGQALRLLATFRPVPLFAVMAGRGFTHTAQPIEGGDWEVLFTPQGAAAAGEPSAAAEDDFAAAPVRSLDNRGLMPPEPMVRTLEAVGAIAPGAILEAFVDREPLFLYDELKARGHAYRSEAQPEGGYRVLIQRALAPAAG